LAEVALKELSPLFEQMYSEVRRPSIPPERLLKASLLMLSFKDAGALEPARRLDRHRKSPAAGQLST
jgi:hypothetical protein